MVKKTFRNKKTNCKKNKSKRRIMKRNVRKVMGGVNMNREDYLVIRNFFNSITIDDKEKLLKKYEEIISSICKEDDSKTYDKDGNIVHTPKVMTDRFDNCVKIELTKLFAQHKEKILQKLNEYNDKDKSKIIQTIFIVFGININDILTRQSIEQSQSKPQNKDIIGQFTNFFMPASVSR